MPGTVQLDCHVDRDSMRRCEVGMVTKAQRLPVATLYPRNGEIDTNMNRTGRCDVYDNRPNIHQDKDR